MVAGIRQFEVEFWIWTTTPTDLEPNPHGDILSLIGSTPDSRNQFRHHPSRLLQVLLYLRLCQADPELESFVVGVKVWRDHRPVLFLPGYFFAHHAS